MNTKELRSQSEKQLLILKEEAQQELRELRFQIASNQLKQVRNVRALRKRIAQINTILSQK